MIPVPSLDRGHELVRRMSGLQVVLLGDVMLDRFLWGTVTRISPEAPVPVVRLGSESTLLGGAGNVARNLLALGAGVNLVGVVGRDRGGEQFRECLEKAGLNGAGLIEIPDRTTTIKTRVIAHHQQVVRIDCEVTEQLPPPARSALIRRTISGLPAARALLISDYDKGVISSEVLSGVLPAAERARIPIAVDPKPSNYEHYRPVTVVTPNAREAREMAGLRGREDPDHLEAGETIRKHLGCAAVLLTQGERGMTLFQASDRPLHVPAVAKEVFDVTGAGDTVIAVLTLALAAGASLGEAAILANVAAGEVVGKLGTAVVTPEELLTALEAAPERMRETGR